jgi:hypothetical protein
MPQEPQSWHPDPPPHWLFWLFLAITGGLALHPAWIGSAVMLIPLVAANVIFLLWNYCAKRTRGADEHRMRPGQSQL